jgi:hypothetical protein
MNTVQKTAELIVRAQYVAGCPMPMAVNRTIIIELTDALAALAQEVERLKAKNDADQQAWLTLRYEAREKAEKRAEDAEARVRELEAGLQGGCR